ncbi:DUF6234 family protein [Streptomyces sp. URMC 129]|uniref:DUF6234 family protein n=1 Tax=Streptomyces sp. URMC 129 TaxID=3423407 RepID=UPI003F1C58F4
MGSPTGSSRGRVHWFSDLLLAFCLFAAEAVAVAYVVFAEGMSSWADSYQGRVSSPDGDSLWICGWVIAALATVAAIALARARAPFAAATQALVVVATLLLMSVAAAEEHSDDRSAPVSVPAPAPASADS